MVWLRLATLTGRGKKGCTVKLYTVEGVVLSQCPGGEISRDPHK